ncbi:hypothetical protein VPH35_006615 [Triticum aestivum]
MARPYHLTLLSVFSFLLLTGLVAADLSGGKKYPAVDSPPGEKTKISMHYAKENGGGDRHLDLDCDNDEPYFSLSVYSCDFSWYNEFLAKIAIDLQPMFRHEVPCLNLGGEDTRCAGVAIRGN